MDKRSQLMNEYVHNLMNNSRNLSGNANSDTDIKYETYSKMRVLQAI